MARDYMNCKRSTIVWLCLASPVVALSLAEDCRAEIAHYQVGVAAVDITPDYPVRLNGFGHRRDEFDGVTQRIWAKAIAIGADKDQPVVLITTDNLGVRLPMVEEVARRLKKKAGIERDRLAVTFTHTHTAPKVRGASETIMGWPVPPEHQQHIDRYTADLTDALEKVALGALADRNPARLQWAVGSVGFAKNRRTEGGPVDHALPMLVVRATDSDAIRAIYVTYACHCVTLSNNQISGDWAGFAQEAIQREHPGAIALVSIGCGSDSNPSSGVTGDNVAAAAEQGAEIAKEVNRLLQGPPKPIRGPIAATMQTIDLPLNKSPNREELEMLAAVDEPAGHNAKFQLEKLDRGEPLQSAIVYPIQTWTFGDSLAMVFLAGEVCVDYSLRLKQEFDADRLWLHAYTNDFGCYIPSERLLKEGGYGGGAEIVFFALPATLAPGLEERIIAEVHRQVPAQFRRADAAATIIKLTDGLAVGTPAEYDRIPAIWRAAIDAGKRNNQVELERLLRISLPERGFPATHWQVVVLGGGIVNGLSQQGIWPQRRLRELVADDAELQSRWAQVVEQSAQMADDESVPAGTRYDALRILGADQFSTHGELLKKYLADENAELQMGAVSGLSDIEDDGAATALVESFAKFHASNRQLAIDALLRTPQRKALLQRAIDEGRVPPDVLTPQQAARLRD
jgi:hypothetical protein